MPSARWVSEGDCEAARPARSRRMARSSPGVAISVSDVDGLGRPGRSGVVRPRTSHRWWWLRPADAGVARPLPAGDDERPGGTSDESPLAALGLIVLARSVRRVGGESDDESGPPEPDEGGGCDMTPRQGGTKGHQQQWRHTRARWWLSGSVSAGRLSGCSSWLAQVSVGCRSRFSAPLVTVVGVGSGAGGTTVGRAHSGPTGVGQTGGPGGATVARIWPASVLGLPAGDSRLGVG